MRAVLTQYDCEEAIDPPDDDGESLHVVPHRVDAKAKSMILMHVSDHLALTVAKATSAREAWLKLEKMHRQKSAARITVLRRELGRLKLRDNARLDKLHAKLLEYQDELAVCGL